MNKVAVINKSQVACVTLTFDLFILNTRLLMSCYQPVQPHFEGHLFDLGDSTLTKVI